MSGQPIMINIGSKENPVMVPEHALQPNTPRGRSYWGGIASGSIVVPDKTLDVLMEKVNLHNEQGNKIS